MSELTPQMRQLLAEASVVSEGPAQSLDSPTSHSKAGATEPRSQGDSLHDRMARRFTSARGQLQERRAVAWASHELARASRSPMVDDSPAQRHYWVVIASQGKEYRDVAVEHGLNEKTVWKMRSEAGYEPRRGHPKAA